MNFIFPHIKRYVFPNTCLKDVLFSLSFKPRSREDIKLKSLVSFFQKQFRLDVTYPDSKYRDICVQSSDNLITLDFSLEHVSLKMKYPAYTSFVSARPYFERIFTYLELLNVTKVKDVQYIKYNELLYERENNQLGKLEDLMQSVFSEDLIRYSFTGNDAFLNEIKEFNTLARWEKRTIIPDHSDSANSIVIDYGFSDKSNDGSKGKLTLKIAFHSKKKDIEVINFYEILDNYDAVLFDAFNWCVKEQLIDNLNK